MKEPRLLAVNSMVNDQKDVVKSGERLEIFYFPCFSSVSFRSQSAVRLENRRGEAVRGGDNFISFLLSDCSCSCSCCCSQKLLQSAVLQFR